MTLNNGEGSSVTRKSSSYRDLLMRAAIKTSPLVEGRPLPSEAAALPAEPRFLSVCLGFEAVRYRLYLQRLAR